MFSANQRPGRSYWFSNLPENTNFIEDIEILLPGKFREFHSAVAKKKSKMYLPIRAAILVFRSARKKNLLANVKIFARCQDSLNSVQRLQGSQKRQGLAFPIGPKKKTHTHVYELDRGHWYTYFFLISFIEFHSAVAEKKSKMSQKIRGQDSHLGFRSVRKQKLGRGRWDISSW